MRPRRLRPLALATALLLSGCASRPELPLEQRPLLWVLPLNFDRATPDSFLPGLEVLAEAVDGYARSEGFACRRIDLATVVERWPAASDQAGGLVDESGRLDDDLLQAARSALVRELAAAGQTAGSADRRPAAVLVPSLVVRQAPFTSRGRRAHWDGVYRKPPIGPGFQLRRDELLFSGSVSATSLWASLYSLDGELLASASGGIEIAVEMSWVDRDGHISSGWQTTYRWVERPDLFQDADSIAKAVDLALEPVLERVPRSP